MDRSVLGCLVEDYEHHIPNLTLPDKDDRHILAAAITCRADIIVTFNEKHFPAQELGKHGIHLKTPDDFLGDIFSLEPDAFVDHVAKDIAHYQRPPITFDHYIEDLESASVPKTAALLKRIRTLFEVNSALAPPNPAANQTS